MINHQGSSRLAYKAAHVNRTAGKICRWNASRHSIRVGCDGAWMMRLLAALICQVELAYLKVSSTRLCMESWGLPLPRFRSWATFLGGHLSFIFNQAQ